MSPIRVDPKKPSDQSELLEWRFDARVVGQPRAIRELVRALQKYSVNLHSPGRPIANLLFLGPTGVGKSELCHALAEILLGSRESLTRIDCSEFNHSHEVAKLMGSPPGYLGHRESDARLSQENLDKWSVPKVKAENGETLGVAREKKPNILLFDEIEKAHEDFFDLLLGIMDTGKLALGNGKQTDFSRTILVMTSNLGAREVRGLIKGASMGFHSGPPEIDRNDLDQQIYKTSKEAAEKFFKPEFINRLDRLIVFRSLDEKSLRQILAIEIGKVKRRLNAGIRYIELKLTEKAKDFLLEEGYSDEYGARELRRAIEKFISDPLAALLATRQIVTGDCLTIGYEGGDGLVFDKTHDPIRYSDRIDLEELTK